MVEEFVTVKQQTTAVSVAFDDEAVADFFEAQVDVGRKPEEFGRTWLHSHPSDSAIPSSVDEETFARVFGGCDWAVMFILARSGATYARVRFNVGPKGELLIPVHVDYSVPFAGSDYSAWQKEYERNIHAEVLSTCGLTKRAGSETRSLEGELAELGASDATEQGEWSSDSEVRVDPDDWWLDEREVWP